MLKKDFLILIVLTFIFTVLLFLLRIFLLEDFTRKSNEEDFIDRSLFIDINPTADEKEIIDRKSIEEVFTWSTDLNSSNTNLTTNTWLLVKNKLNGEINNKISNESDVSKSNLYFIYFPDDFKKEAFSKSLLLKKFVLSEFFYWKILDFWVELHKETFDVRWKMKDARVKLFGVLNISAEEILSVFTHEFWHYIDIYYLTTNDFSDIDLSLDFYDISWVSTKIIKPSMSQKDFVSGYAMTNKYEDFAESFTYYVLHNSSFKKKTEKSKIMKLKYEYFQKFLFKNNEFLDTDFSSNDSIDDYYRDITKIDINSKKFLQYLKKSI